MTEPDSRFAPPSQTPIEPTTSRRGWKISGCALGCAALAGLAVVGIGLCIWWFVGTGAQHPTDVAVGPESTGSFEIGDVSKDEDARAAVDAVVRELQRRTRSSPRTERPSWFPADDSRFLSTVVAQAFPRSGTLSLEPVAGEDEPAVVVVVNLRGFTRPLRRIFESADAEISRYRGVSIVEQSHGETSLAMVDGTWVIASHPQAIRDALDRLLDGAGEPAESRLEVLEPLDGEAPLLSGGTDFEPGELTAALLAEQAETGEPPPVDPAVLSGVRRVELVADHVDPAAIRFRVGVRADSPEDARRAAPAVAELLRRELEGVDLEVTPRLQGSNVFLDARVSAWVEPFVASLAGGSAGENEDLPAEAVPAP